MILGAVLAGGLSTRFGSDKALAQIGGHTLLARAAVQRLTEAGVMQIVAVTDPMQLGFTRQAMIGIRVSGDVREVAEALGELEAVDYVVDGARRLRAGRVARDREA